MSRRRRRSADEALGRSDEPLDHASAEVDIAEAQVALGQEGPSDGDGDDGSVVLEDGTRVWEDGSEVAPDELDEDADRSASPRRRRAGEGSERSVATRAEAHPAGGNKLAGFLRASWRELQRVQWPDRKQVAQATGVVLVFTIVAGLFLGAADLVFQKLVDLIL